MNLRFLRASYADYTSLKSDGAVQKAGKFVMKTHRPWDDMMTLRLNVALVNVIQRGFTLARVVPIPQGTTSRRGRMKDTGHAAFTFRTDFDKRLVVPCISIGTTVPGAPLHVYKSSNFPEVFVDYGVSGQMASLLTGNAGAMLGYSGYLSIGTVTGAQSAGASEKIRVMSNGNVGIGTTAPAASLQIAGGSNTVVVGNASEVTTSDSLIGGIKFLNSGQSAQAGIESRINLSGAANNADLRFYTSLDWNGGNTYAERMRIDRNGWVGIGTTSPGARLQVGSSGDGSAALANAWNTFSDARLKRDLVVIPDALDKLLALHGYYYFWKEGSDQTRQVGVIAQEVESVLPELVHAGSDGIKTVDYPKLTALLIEAAKQLKLKEQAIESKARAIEAENKDIKAKAQATENKLDLLLKTLCEKDQSASFCH